MEDRCRCASARAFQTRERPAPAAGSLLALFSGEPWHRSRYRLHASVRENGWQVHPSPRRKCPLKSVHQRSFGRSHNKGPPLPPRLTTTRRRFGRINPRRCSTAPTVLSTAGAPPTGRSSNCRSSVLRAPIRGAPRLSSTIRSSSPAGAAALWIEAPRWSVRDGPEDRLPRNGAATCSQSSGSLRSAGTPTPGSAPLLRRTPR